MLILDPSLNGLAWYSVDSKGVNEGKIDKNQGIDVLASLESFNNCDTFGYVLEHGGELELQPVSLMDNQSIDLLIPCLRFSPNTNRMTIDAARFCLEHKPEAKHILLCETTFFNQMPDVNRIYALPQVYQQKGYRRYGGDGLCHQWAMKQFAALSTNAAKCRVVSLHLCNHPTLAAIRNGRAVDSSQGFSLIEGLSSLTTCGDIDPAIVLLMAERGSSPAEITTFLSQQSGVMALLPEDKRNLVDILSDKKSSTQLVREIFFNKIIEFIGSEIASMGGLDALVFTVDNYQQTYEFIKQICDHLAFLNITLLPEPIEGNESYLLTHSSQSCQVITLPINRWQLLTAAVQSVHL